MVELGKSKVPLEEDLIKKPIEFVKSWVEFAANNFEQIVRSFETSAAGLTAIFEVPSDKTFFLTNLSVAIVCILNTNVSGIIASPFGTKRLIEVHAAAGGQAASSHVFNMPIKFQAGEKISIDFNGDGSTSAQVIGFQIDKIISP